VLAEDRVTWASPPLVEAANVAGRSTRFIDLNQNLRRPRKENLRKLKNGQSLDETFELPATENGRT
jgi:hypothetical protein